jgi:hypothetical protein
VRLCGSPGRGMLAVEADRMSRPGIRGFSDREVGRASSSAHEERGTKTTWTWLVAPTLALAVLVASGCAGTGSSPMPLPPAKMLQPPDLASLAGEWHGTLRGSGGPNPAAGRSAVGTMTLAPDGSYTTNVSGQPGAGKARIEGGKIVFEGSATRGTATFYEGDGRRILKGEGTWVGFPANTEFELTKR